MDRPKTSEGFTAEKSDISMIKLLGGARFENVAFTTTQMRRFEKLYDFDLRKEDNVLMKAGSTRNLLRHVQTDGLRVMAFLAKHGLLEDGVDPVTSLAHAIDQDLFSTCPDIWNEEEE